MSMPPERHSKIEDLLKAWAAKRRAQAGGEFEMHPATRKLLHGEVARRVRRPHASASFWGWQSLWVRLGAACALVVVIVGVVLWQRPPPTQMASLDQKADSRRQVQEKLEERKSLNKELAAADGERRVDRDGLASQVQSTSGLAVPAAPPPAAVAPPAPLASTAPSSAARTSVAASKPGAAKEEKAPATQPELRLAFQQTATRTKDFSERSKMQGPGVLNQFTVERNGQKVRVIDSDGSIYEGEVANLVDQLGLADAGTNAMSQRSEFAFRVSGLSKQVNQPVVFAGSVSLPGIGDVQLQGGFGGGAVGGIVTNQLDKAKRAEISPRASITGRVQIGGTNDFPIQAGQR